MDVAKNTSLLSALARSSTCGLCVYAGANVISAALSGRLLSKPQEVANTIASGRCLKFGAFFGGFTAIYRLIIKYLRHFRQREDGLNALIASALAGIVIKLQPRDRRSVLLLFISSRGFGALFNTLLANRILPSSPACTVLTYCLGVGLIIQSAILYPDQLPPSYYKSLLRWSGCATDEGLAGLFRQQSSQQPRLTCKDYLHPKVDSCTKNILYNFLESWSALSKLYGVLYVVPLMLFRRKTLIQRPWPVIQSIIFQSLRSGAFLAVACSIVITSFCVLSNIMQKRGHDDPSTWPDAVPSYIPFGIGCLAGMTILIERQSRHFELLLYVLPIIVHALAKSLQRKGLLPPLRHASVFIFGASMMAIMHAFEFHKDSLSPFLYRFLSFLIR